jgi:hypothetical protein
MSEENQEKSIIEEKLEELKSLYLTKQVAKAILDAFAARKNNAKSLTVDRIMTLASESGRVFSRGEVIEVLKKLDDLQFGSFLNGRRGQPTRMNWNVRIVSLGKAAAGESVQIEKLQANDVDLEAGDNVGIAEEAHCEDSMDVSFPLRSDFDVSLSLPKNLSAKEAARLANFIQLLVFEDECPQN